MSPSGPSTFQDGDGYLQDLALTIRQTDLGQGDANRLLVQAWEAAALGTLEAGRSSENPPGPETRRQSSLRAPAEKADGRDRMYHNRAASYIWVCLGETLTAAYQAEAIRRLADALGMTVAREYEDEEYGWSPGDRPQFQRMMEEVRSEPKPFCAIIAYDRVRFAASAANLTKYVRDLQDAGVELLCVWDKPPRNTARARRPGGGGRPEGLGNRRQ